MKNNEFKQLSEQLKKTILSEDKDIKFGIFLMKSDETEIKLSTSLHCGPHERIAIINSVKESLEEMGLDTDRLFKKMGTENPIETVYAEKF